ncbi:hypothetical protein SAMN05421505_1032 [Sinosporangium album]|uniref:Uncharacterized protein n=1 Tax=Sinosporangium album TaxID=504805 RepID=A0A1G7SWV0_9ACTN|nr:hypothetical protein [Sinosporangium album]SDG27557.1 hypothetical protein SAMN05421505_1032 [Sinosporangium album]
MSATPSFRLLRAAVFAVACLGLAVLAHRVGEGREVDVRTALAGLALAFAGAFPLAGRERGTAVILPLLTAVQAGLHLLFAAAEPAVHGPGHVHSGLTADIGMLVAHGWAVLLTALWLARGEAVLWALLRRAGVRLSVFLLAWWSVPEPLPQRAVAAPPEPRLLRSAVLCSAVGLRGPPRVVFAAL